MACKKKSPKYDYHTRKDQFFNHSCVVSKFQSQTTEIKTAKNKEKMNEIEISI